MHTQNVYEIFWQAPGWQAFDSTYMTQIQNWVTDVSADNGKPTNPFFAVTQYSDGSGPGNYNVHLGGSVLVKDAPDQFAHSQCPHGRICISEQSLVDEIDRVRLAHGWSTGMSNQFAIILPSGVTTCDVTATCSDDVFCAYHSYYTTTPNDDPATDVVFLTLPYEDAQGCHSPNGVTVEPEPNGQADVLIGSMSHEMREATTDPHFDGWWNPNPPFDESDDQCNTNYGRPIGPSQGFNQFINGHPYETQLEWSNALDDCYQMDPPTASGVNVSEANAGDRATITGTNLFARTVSVGNAQATNFTFSADGHSLSFVVPYAATDGPLAVGAPAGSVTVPGGLTIGPGVSAISPTAGPVHSVVTIQGGNFSGLTSLTFAGTDTPAAIDSNSQLQILVTVPPNAIAGPVTITTHRNGVTHIGTSSISFFPTPTVTSLSAPTAKVGAVVTVNGANLNARGPVSVSINGVTACSGCAATPTTVRFPVPNTASGKITVTNGDGSATTSATLGILPSITSVVGSATPGSKVTITGGGFASVTSVSFGDGTEPATFNIGGGGSTIQAFVPSNVTAGHIAVTNDVGTTLSPTVFGGTPAISSFAPTSAPVGSTVNVTGIALGDADRVDFAGGVSATPTAVTPTSLQVVIPAGAQTGPMSVHTSAGTATSSRPLTISFSVSRFAPVRADYGATVTITGSALTGTTGVLFNGVPGANVTVVDDSHVTVTVPATGNLTGRITVVNGGVSMNAPGLFTLFGLHSATPTSGSVGTTVVISGVGLSAVTRVRFGGVDATFTVDSDTQITVKVPSGAASGPIVVSFPGGSASLAFTVGT